MQVLAGGAADGRGHEGGIATPASPDVESPRPSRGRRPGATCPDRADTSACGSLSHAGENEDHRGVAVGGACATGPAGVTTRLQALDAAVRDIALAGFLRDVPVLAAPMTDLPRHGPAAPVWHPVTDPDQRVGWMHTRHALPGPTTEAGPEPTDPTTAGHSPVWGVSWRPGAHRPGRRRCWPGSR